MVVPIGWEEKSLLDYAELLQGLTYKPENVKPYGLLVLRSSNIKRNKLSFDDCVFVDYEVDKMQYVQKGDILICVRNGSNELIGKCALVDADFNATFGAFMSVLRADNSDFIFQMFRSDIVQKQIRGNSNATINQITKGDFARIIIPVPVSSSEQTAIAEALSDADSLIYSLEKLIAKKKAIKQGAMQELLTGKKRLPGFSGEWQENQYKNICAFVNGRAYKQEELLNKGKYRVLRLGNLFTSEHWYYSNLELPEHQYCDNNDLIYAWSASFGPSIWSGEKVIYHYHIWKVICTDEIDKKYLFYYFAFDVQRILNELQGGTMFHLTKDSMERRKCLYPKMEEQVAIASILSDMDAEIEQLEKKLAKYRHIKQGMMQELLTGRIRLVANESETTPVDEKADIKPNTSHNESFQDAVILVALVNAFGSEQHPFTAFDCQKFPYLLHRHLEGVAKGYGEFAAGPYNSAQKYKTARPIALKKKYIKEHIGNYKGFVTDENAQEALTYFSKWYGEEPLKWMEQFRRIPKRKDELELLTTVDMAMVKLREKAVPVTTLSVKQYIHQSKEWKAKLNRELFSDDNIGRAIEWSNKLFG